MAQLYIDEDYHIAISVVEALLYPGRVHDTIKNKMAKVYCEFGHGVTGWKLKESEYNDNIRALLLFVEFAFDEDESVTLIIRAHDLYIIGHLGQNRHAFLLKQGRMNQLRKTQQCLNMHNIPYTVMESIGDSYPALESKAQIQRMELNIGQEGFKKALNNLRGNPLANIENTAFSYLYLAVFICEGMRIMHIRDSIIGSFAGEGMAVPENFLQYLYGWGAASYILAAYATNNQAPLNYYHVRADHGRMGVVDMSWAYPLIKHARAPRHVNTDMMALYQSTVDRYRRNILGELP